MNKGKKWPYTVAILMIVATAIFVQSRSHGEELVPNKPFADFPLLLADQWKGRELSLDDDVLNVLKLSDYMNRVYVPIIEQPKQENASDSFSVMRNPGKDITIPVWLYVGFYQSQRTGATYHSPKNCLPGAGWQFMESDIISVQMPGAQNISINKVLIQKGLEKQIILYWYHDRGRVIASEYWAKGYLVWDAMTQNRSDGSLVRISVPVQNVGVDEAFEHGLGFLRDLWPVLLEYMPDQSIV